MNRWFRFYDQAYNDTKVLLLPSDTLRWQWIILLCVASQHGGEIPSIDVAAVHLRLKPAKAAEVITRLSSAGLLDRTDGGYFHPHNWTNRQFKSDHDPTSAERQRRFRERHSNALRNGDETRTETESETKTESETDQRSLTSSSSTSSQGIFCENVKKKGWTPPAHCAVSRDKRRIYIEANTPEWAAYSADFSAVHQREPQPNPHGGKWFFMLGEENAR